MLLDLKLTPIIVALPVCRKMNGELYYKFQHYMMYYECRQVKEIYRVFIGLPFKNESA